MLNNRQYFKTMRLINVSYSGVLSFLLGVVIVVSGNVSFAQNEQTSNAQRNTIGKLGQMLVEAPIFIKPDKRSKIISKTEKEQYVVMRDLTSDWATVVMHDGSNGYIEAKHIDRLPFEVNIAPPNANTSRGPGRTFDNNQVSRGGDWTMNLLREAQKYIGTPYKWGGNSLRSGVDCSGYVQQLFAMFGMALPRTAEQQSAVGMPIARLDQLEPGDRLYFTDSKRERITHTGIYMGNGYFIHSSSGNKGVAIDFLSEKWLKIMVDARR